MTYEITEDFVFLGKVIKERCRNNSNIKLISDDYEEGMFELNYEQLNDENWYSVSKNKGTLKLTKITLVNSNEDLDDWL